MELARKHLYKNPTEKVIYLAKKNLNINPFTKKVNTKLSQKTTAYVNDVATGKGNNQKVLAYSNKDIDAIKRELNKYDVTAKDIDEQLNELNRVKDSLGMMNFDWGSGVETYKNQLVLFVAKSKSGKSYTVNSLILELPVSFDSITVFTGKNSYENIATQSLRKLCEAAGIHFAWINTDNKEPVDYAEESMSFEDYTEKYKMEDGSMSKIYNNTFGTVHIYDDLYNKEKDHWVVHLMDDVAIFGRHKRINAFILFQGFTRLSSKILDNATKIFIFNDYVHREDIWPKLKIDEPENLKECQLDLDPPRFYYLEDNLLVPYVNYEYSSKNQVIKKLESKLPIGLKQKKKEYEAKAKIFEEMKKQEQQDKKEEDERKFKEKDKKDEAKEQKRIVANNHVDVGSIRPSQSKIPKESNAPRITSVYKRSGYNPI